MPLSTRGFFVEPKFEVTRDGIDLAAVVKRHHVNAEEKHRRDGADPIKMCDIHSVLERVARHPEQLESAEVRRSETG